MRNIIHVRALRPTIITTILWQTRIRPVWVARNNNKKPQQITTVAITTIIVSNLINPRAGASNFIVSMPMDHGMIAAPGVSSACTSSRSRNLYQIPIMAVMLPRIIIIIIIRRIRIQRINGCTKRRANQPWSCKPKCPNKIDNLVSCCGRVFCYETPIKDRGIILLHGVNHVIHHRRYRSTSCRRNNNRPVVVMVAKVALIWHFRFKTMPDVWIFGDKLPMYSRWRRNGRLRHKCSAWRQPWRRNITLI